MPSTERDNGQPSGMPRVWTWMQVVLGWLPIGALFATLIITAHPGSTYRTAALVATRMVFSAALLGVLVHALTRRFPWPRRFSFRFVGVHLLGAAVFTHSWILLNSLLVSLVRGQPVLEIGGGIGPFLILGVWIYVMIIGVSYAAQATERAVRAEALAARAQLDALRAQLNPHFLFNALHTVVQLIPRDPERATKAAEQVAGLLRTAVEEERDLVTLADEWRFVERYLAIEALRFGDRLIVQPEMDRRTMQHMVPSYSLQTLVENAVRHGAAPNLSATTVRISSSIDGGQLVIRVNDDGVGRGSLGATNDGANNASKVGAGARGATGLARLEERARVLHGKGARLVTRANEPQGFTAELHLPLITEQE